MVAEIRERGEQSKNKPIFFKKIVLLPIIAGVVAIAAVFFWYQTTQAAIGTLQVYEGGAEVVRDGQPLESKTGTKLKLSDSVKVKPDSRVSIILKGGNVVRVEANSEVEISSLTYEGENIGSAILKLKSGRIWSRVGSVANEGNFQVETPTSVASVRGTSFNTDYLMNTSAFHSSVNQIEYSLLNIDQVKILPEGMWVMLHDETLVEDFEDEMPMPPPEEFFDDWIEFNEQEDDKICLDDSSTPGCEHKRNKERITMQSDMDMSVPTTTMQPTQTKMPTIMKAMTPTPTPTLAPQIQILTVTADPNSAPGQQAVIKAIAKYSNTTEEDVTTKADWHQDPTLGTFSDNYYKPDKTGVVTIYAEFMGKKSNEVKINIQEPKTLTRIGVSHSTFNCQSYTAQFTATVYYSDNSTQIVTESTSWSLKTPTYSKIDSSGLYTAGDVNQDTIIAQYEGKTVETPIYPYTSC